MQDTDDLYSVPADSANLAAEWGVAPVPQHRASFGGSINLPDDYAVYPFVTWTSELPFNITSGNDTNFDSVFTDRPSLAEAGQAGAVATPFGVFNPNPRPGEPVIARNFGIGPTNFTFDVTAAKMFAATTADAFVPSRDGSAERHESAEPHELCAVQRRPHVTVLRDRQSRAQQASCHLERAL